MTQGFRRLKIFPFVLQLLVMETETAGKKQVQFNLSTVTNFMTQVSFGLQEYLDIMQTILFYIP